MKTAVVLFVHSVCIPTRVQPVFGLNMDVCDDAPSVTGAGAGVFPGPPLPTASYIIHTSSVVT